jgi:Amt family ammonium transporter
LQIGFSKNKKTIQEELKMKKIFAIMFSYVMIMLLSVSTAFADATEVVDPAKIDSGDTAFMLICSALVLIMTPGLALFYGGMVRGKNVLNTIMQSFFVIGVISIQWVLWGYSLSFGPDIHHFIGSLAWFGLNDVGQLPNADYAATIPHLVFMIFQAMFAVITPALITGSSAERMKFPAFVVFVLLWATFVYDPIAHWVWGTDGWMHNMGILDFAGGTVVHISSGVSGLIIALMIGKRKGYGTEIMLPHNLPMTVIGASLLWFGWFGFNAGSALAANGLAASAFVVTHIAAAAATVTWVVVEWLYHGKPTILGAASGCVAGLVAITPASGYVSTLPAIAIGGLGGIICFFAVSMLKAKIGYDDALDAFGVHGIGGTWGAIATGFFASKAVNPAGDDGLFFGNPDLVLTQLIGVATTWVFAAVMTFILIKIISVFMQVRADDGHEEVGLDITEHGERGYSYQDVSAGSSLSFASILQPTESSKSAKWETAENKS